MPRFADVLENVQYTSFPVLFPATVRAYTTLFGASDSAMRIFGLLAGVALLGLAWFQSKTLSGEVPLVFPALIGFNTIFLTVGTSIRGYGLGCVLVILAFTLTARLLLQPSGGKLAAVFVAYLASMHCLYFNATLIPGIVLAATAAWYWRGRFKWALLLLGVALVTAISYIPYLIRVSSNTKEYAVVLSAIQSLGSLRQNIISAFGAPAPIMAGAWFGILTLTATAAVWRLVIIWRRKPAPEWDLILFALLSALFGTVACFAFLRVLHNEPNVRYFLALLCVIAAAVDLIVANLSRFYSVRLARVVLVIILTVALPFAAWSRITERQTNIDTLAQKLQTDAGPNDLIIVNPWSLGTSFHRYYLGPARWMTVPQLSEHRINRYDLLKQKMTAFFPLDDLEREMSATLKSGNRVWVVGGVDRPPAGKRPLLLTPAPDPMFGWNTAAYRKAWSEQLGAFFERRALHIDRVISKDKAVNDHENVSLIVAEGWRD